VYHAEPPREPATPRDPAPIAHFEPQPKPDSGSAQKQPYVVWSSAPEKPSSGHEPEE